MTTRRVILSLATAAVVIVAAGVWASRLFPLEVQAQAGRQLSGRAVEIVRGGEQLLHGELAEYPRRAIERKVEGDVVVALTIDDSGQVSDASVLSGPDELRRAALESVLRWHFSPQALRSTSTQATLRFNLAAALAESREEPMTGFAKTVVPGGEPPTRAQQIERQMVEIKMAMADPAAADQIEELRKRYEELTVKLAEFRGAVYVMKDDAPPGPTVIAQIKNERASVETVAAIIARAGVRIGDPFNEQVARRIKEAAASIDEHIRVDFHTDRKTGGAIVMISTP